MDNFNVPKKINRNVMKALSILQATHSITAFVPAETIIRQVEFQMRRNKKVDNVEHFVLKSLCSLTHLGIVVRTGTSEYALRQSLEFTNGVRAIPWKLLSDSPYDKKTTKKRPNKRSYSKSTIRKSKIKKSSTLPKPVQRSIRKAASKGKVTPVGIKECVVVCSNVLAKRKNEKMEYYESLARAHSLIEKPKYDNRTAHSSSLLMPDSRWQFSSPISLIGSQGY